MRKILLVIGDPMMNDTRFEPSLNRFMTYKEKLNKRGIGVIFITYDDVVSKRLPNISTKRLDVMLFFPYNHWNEEIEIYGKDARVYGDAAFGKDYTDYMLKIDKIVKRRYRDKNLTFVNPPSACVIDRDKKETFLALTKNKIETPKIYNVKKVSDIDKLINNGSTIYIKPRFGAMGKGITYVNSKGVYTNFLYKNSKIVNRLYDYNWRPVKIAEKNRNNFLKLLLNEGFIFQEAVNTPIVEDRKFDIRVYVAYGKVPYFYAKSAPVKSFITNWSQGGRIEKKAFLNKALSKSDIEKVKSVAIKAAKVIDLKFAGVDVIIDRDTKKTYVLEIQSFPGYERGYTLMKHLANTI